MKAEAIVSALTQATSKWTKARKAEERERARISRRREILVRPYRETIKDVAWEIMERAYLKASANGTLPAHARQIMYAARPEIQERTGRRLDDQYFTQTLLPDYINACPEAAAWDVVYDARGHFTEPFTKKIVPLGTLDVRRYLGNVRAHTVGRPTLTLSDKMDFPTCGPAHRFGAILFIEKEGFFPLFERVQLAERYDLAIMSTKGLSVTASRLLVDDLCGGENPVPLLVVHDFDKAGFSILGTLQRDTRRYEFLNVVDVIDLGLRFADVQTCNLQSETVAYGRADPTWNLRENGASQEEIQFLCNRNQFGHYTGLRVELNAFASNDLVAWLEGKLKAHGVRKVVPDSETLEAAYRRAWEVEIMHRHVEEIAEEAKERAERAPIPKGLGRTVAKKLKTKPEQAWDQIVADLVAERLDDDADDEGTNQP